MERQQQQWQRADEHLGHMVVEPGQAHWCREHQHAGKYGRAAIELQATRQPVGAVGRKPQAEQQRAVVGRFRPPGPEWQREQPGDWPNAVDQQRDAAGIVQQRGVEQRLPAQQHLLRMPEQPEIMTGVHAAAGDSRGEIACGRPGERDAERGVEQHCYAMLAPGRNQRGSMEPAPWQRSCYLYHINKFRSYVRLFFGRTTNDEGRKLLPVVRRPSSFYETPISQAASRSSAEKRRNASTVFVRRIPSILDSPSGTDSASCSNSDRRSTTRMSKSPVTLYTSATFGMLAIDRAISAILSGSAWIITKAVNILVSPTSGAPLLHKV